jgi:DNA/RNA endonuclease YhcR with UshA esterase domain|tara:strand:+ start:206 stop:517 length:312 start_codon:yes stop_codon:yes gene_type:complete
MLEKQKFHGILSYQVLFVGSKSEGEYLTLQEEIDASNNFLSRVYLKTPVANENEELLNSFLGKKIEIVGLKDDVRGYPRIVADSIKDISITEDQEESKKEDGV